MGSTTTKAAAEPVVEKVYAKYTGLPGIVSERVFSKQDLVDAGLTEAQAGEGLSFNRSNRFLVDVSEVSPEVMEILKEDPDITLTKSQNPTPPAIFEMASVDNGPSASGLTTPGSGVATATATGVTGSTSTGA